MGPVTTPMPGLFILWEKARHCEARILDDLQRRFTILRAHEVHWTPEHISRNFRRFYSDIDVSGVAHQYNKGGGAFVAVTLLDTEPVMEVRATSRGPRVVNSRFLDAKMQYREWTGLVCVHSGECDWENNRDITMLLGEDPHIHAAQVTGPWDGQLERLDRDLAGARGWRSAEDLFRTLNEVVPYVVISAADPINASADAAEPVEILTEQYHELITILNARHRHGTAPTVGGRFRISVAGRPVEVIIRRVGDGLLDEVWEREILERRQWEPQGYYRLAPSDAFELRAYRTLVHRAHVSSADRTALAHAAQQIGATRWTEDSLASPDQAKALLDELMERNGRDYVRPRDLGVFFNHRFIGRTWPTLRAVSDVVQRMIRSAVDGAIGRAKHGYLRSRDQILQAAPWIRWLRLRRSARFQ